MYTVRGDGVSKENLWTGTWAGAWVRVTGGFLVVILEVLRHLARRF